MKSFVISENRDSYLGMKLAGIEGADRWAEAKNLLQRSGNH